MLIDMTLDKYINEAASGSPTPGGGSVCALTGALGAALSSMVGEITLTKDISSQEKMNMQGMISICRNLIDGLKKAVDDDTHAFDKVMEAYHMPKSTEEEKNVRSKAIQEALKGATELPYETALLCFDVMNISIDMLKSGNKGAASDASVAGFLGYAGLNGALYNVKINLNTIKDEYYVEKMRANVDNLISESEGLLSKIKSLSADIIG